MLIVNEEALKNENALIKLPVKTVIKTAVLRGLRFQKLSLAFPIRLPSKSPNVARMPPRRSKEIISSQPDT